MQAASRDQGTLPQTELAGSTAGYRAMDLVCQLQRHQGLLRDAASLAAADLPDGMERIVTPTGAQPVSSGGRQAAWYVSGVYGQAVLRFYRRGGMVARINRQAYLWRGAEQTRAFAELRLMARLYGLGLPVPRPLAATYRRQGGLFYRAAILTQRIDGVRTLAQSLSEADPARVAGAIAAMHQVGVWHADLNAHNILLDGDGKVWLIDFDRGKDYGAPLSQALRVANMQRLLRSLVKVRGDAGQALWRDVERSYADSLREN